MFDKVKRVVAHNIIIYYPEFNSKFDIYTDARYFQLGVVIRQEGRTISFYSRKLAKHKKKYRVTEKETMIIVETLKEFHIILLGQ